MAEANQVSSNSIITMGTWHRQIQDGPLPVPTPGTNGAIILDLLIEAAERLDGLIDEETITASGIVYRTMGVCRRKLRDQGWIAAPGPWRYTSGDTATRSKALIWFLTQTGADQCGLTEYDFKKVTRAQPSNAPVLGPKRPPPIKSRRQPVSPATRTAMTAHKRSPAEAEADHQHEQQQSWRIWIQEVTAEFSQFNEIPEPSQLAEALKDGLSYFSTVEIQCASNWLADFAHTWSQPKKKEGVTR